MVISVATISMCHGSEPTRRTCWPAPPRSPLDRRFELLGTVCWVDAPKTGWCGSALSGFGDGDKTAVIYFYRIARFDQQAFPI